MAKISTCKKCGLRQKAKGDKGAAIYDYCECAERIPSKLNSLVRWQTIDSAPLDGTRVLLWSEEWMAPSSGSHYGGGKWMMHYDLGEYLHNPTHWMELPEPPNATNQAEA